MYRTRLLNPNKVTYDIKLDTNDAIYVLYSLNGMVYDVHAVVLYCEPDQKDHVTEQK